jgi:hypothetical protein
MLEPFTFGSTHVIKADIPESGVNRREPSWRSSRVRQHIKDWLHMNTRGGWGLYSQRIEAPSQENQWQEKTRETILFYEERDALMFELFWRGE